MTTRRRTRDVKEAEGKDGRRPTTSEGTTPPHPTEPGTPLGTGIPRGHGTKAQAPREGNPAVSRLTNQAERHTHTPGTQKQRAAPRLTTFMATSQRHNISPRPTQRSHQSTQRRHHPAPEQRYDGVTRHSGTAKHGTTRSRTAHRSKAHCRAAQRNKANHHTTHHGTTRHGMARQSRVHRNTAQNSTVQDSKAQRNTAGHTKAHHSTKARDGNRLEPRKGRESIHSRGTTPHQPTTHGPEATTRPSVQPPPPAGGAPPAQTTTTKLNPPPQNRHRGGGGTRDNPTRLTHDLTKLAGTTAQRADPEPNPTGQATSPCVYVTHTTHGGRAWPAATQNTDSDPASHTVC